jgi:DNA-binding MarR family transcriptional regulator
VFAFFNEIGIISQLSSAQLQKVLPDGLHPSHFAILNHLMRLGDGKTPASMASAFQITKATMTHSLGVLSKKDYIRLEANADDGRSKLVYITAKGKACRDQSIQLISQMIGEKMSDAQIEHMRHLIEPLSEIRKVMDENR